MSKKYRADTKVVAVDFDGTLATMFDTRLAYRPKTKIKQKPKSDVVEYCKFLHNNGVKIIIHSSRWWGDFRAVKEWLHKYKIHYDDIVLGKFKCDLFLDDLNVNPAKDLDWKNKANNILRLKTPRRKK